MSELIEILPMPARVAKHGRCAEGLSVKTMLGDRLLQFEVNEIRVFTNDLN